MQRLFIAARLPQHISPSIEERQGALRNQLDAAQDDLCWTAPEQFHLTLAFLGEIPSAKIAAIAQLLEDHCKNLPPLQLEIGKCGFFARRGVPTILWCHVHVPSELSLWCAQLRQSLHPLCPEMDTKEFHPHLTLARLKRGKSISRKTLTHLFDSAELCAAQTAWPLTEISLIRSEHGCHGALHSPIVTHQLHHTADR